MCNPRAAGLAEWKMERIEKVVKPNDSQRAALETLRTASAKAAEMVTSACPQDFPASAPARLEAMEKRMEVMLQAIKTVRPAFDAFFATLNDEQKAQLNNNAGPPLRDFRELSRQMMLEGVISIIEGMNPRMLEIKLAGFQHGAASEQPAGKEFAA